MQFDVQKDVLVKALRDVTSAVATRVVQPILSNVLIETRENSTLRFQGTDLDITIETRVPGMISESGSITLPGKKLLEVVSKLPNKTVHFKINPETLETTVTCERSKFNLTGLPSDDFPKLVDSKTVDGVLMPSEILKRSIQQTGFAAANYDASSVLGGVYLVINEGVFECTATDGSRLAHRKEELSVSAPSARRVESDKEADASDEKKAATATLDKPMYLKAIVPARACTELVKLLDAQEEGGKAAAKSGATTGVNEVRIAMVAGQIVFETENHYLSSRLIGGEYPRYQELFPSEYKYLGELSADDFAASIERVAVMSDDRTHLVKLHFEGDTLQVSANTPDVGQAQDETQVKFEGQVLDIAVNVRYLIDVLQRLSGAPIRMEMTGPLKPIIIKTGMDDKYRYLLMPVQAR